MITLTILLVLMFICIILAATFGAGFLIAFGDFIVAALILYGIYKLVTNGKSKKD